MNIKERLSIKNFFSITEFDWKIKKFNILTGNMGAGKSLCLKLLYFFEQVFNLAIFSTPIGEDAFFEYSIYDRLNGQFNAIFHCSEPESYYKDTEIIYSFTMGSKKFDLNCKWNKESKKLQWASEYINNHAKKWQQYIKLPNTVGMVDTVRSRIFEDIYRDFPNALPLGAMFIPASRAIAALTEDIQSSDFFVKHFKMLKGHVLSTFKNPDKKQGVYNILNVKNISVHNTELKTKELELVLSTGRKISPLELSSGQQELVYLLLLINELDHTGFEYGVGKSIFIEEPSTHLFPKEQKQTMEFLINIFNSLQNGDSLCRFFISTHSPYILNVINNILDKGHLLKCINNFSQHEVCPEIQKRFDDLKFPALSIDDVSAYMIEIDGHVEQMTSGESGSEYLYSNVIEKITRNISSDTDQLFELRQLILELEK